VQVVIISGATGSGKTTQVSTDVYFLQYIHVAGTKVHFRRVQKDHNALQYCLHTTEAISGYKHCKKVYNLFLYIIIIKKFRVAEELGEEVGRTVGYQIGLDRQASDKDTKLLFVTTGFYLFLIFNFIFYFNFNFNFLF
jgi:hypothetical protein